MAPHVCERPLLRSTTAIEEFEDQLDDGTRVHVALEIDAERLRVDFSECSDQVAGNANTPRAVAVAAVLYVLRTLVGRPIPLNQGCLEPVEIVTRPGSLLQPDRGRAVCSGNVETSQRIVDVLLGALGLAAASQGTMNNVTFGNASFGYYETLAGGSGATASARGGDAVHTHMTNTRITDAEVLESRFPRATRNLRDSSRHGRRRPTQRRRRIGAPLPISGIRAMHLADRAAPHATLWLGRWLRRGLWA